ncbi:hypothetical protein [Actinacidiphila sp. bgisy144]|uniref:hypothetical protein n=1 Tax=Actinacidiphila sp. bgisy144 TaxID=3413791 RepID=UPI003EC053C8
MAENDLKKSMERRSVLGVYSPYLLSGVVEGQKYWDLWEFTRDHVIPNHECGEAVSSFLPEGISSLRSTDDPIEALRDVVGYIKEPDPHRVWDGEGPTPWPMDVAFYDLEMRAYRSWRKTCEDLIEAAQNSNPACFCSGANCV